MKNINLFLAVLIAMFLLFSCSSGNKFSTYSDTEQEELYNDLSERLDQCFIPVIQEYMLLFLIVDNENLEDAILEKISVEMLDICEQWAIDNNIDFDDWVNTCAENFSIYYVLHLLQMMGELE